MCTLFSSVGRRSYRKRSPEGRPVAIGKTFYRFAIEAILLAHEQIVDGLGH